MGECAGRSPRSRHCSRGADANSMPLSLKRREGALEAMSRKSGNLPTELAVTTFGKKGGYGWRSGGCQSQSVPHVELSLFILGEQGFFFGHGRCGLAGLSGHECAEPERSVKQ